MKTKIYYGRDLIGRFNCDGRKYSKFQIFKFKAFRFIKRTTLVVASINIIAWAIVGGYNYAKSSLIPVTVFADKIVEVPVEIESPVMARIAKCESGNIQFKNGQVVINVNTNGTYDQGRYQINSIWNKKAGEMGYNLSVEKDNAAFAMYLYKNYGTEPWGASRANCWNK